MPNIKKPRAQKEIEALLAQAHKMRRAHDDAYFSVEFFSQKQFTKELAFHEMKQVHFEGQVIALERCLNILRDDQYTSKLGEIS